MNTRDFALAVSCLAAVMAAGQATSAKERTAQSNRGNQLVVPDVEIRCPNFDALHLEGYLTPASNGWTSSPFRAGAVFHDAGVVFEGKGKPMELRCTYLLYYGGVTNIPDDLYQNAPALHECKVNTSNNGFVCKGQQVQ